MSPNSVLMCGLAGILAWEDRYRVRRDVLGADVRAHCASRAGWGGAVRQSRQIRHPLGRSAGSCTDGWRSSTSIPAQISRSRRHSKTWIVFNGEIYNFRELRDELEAAAPDYTWRTHRDTEVLLAAYDVWGEKCVEQLNGMFAFAIWDEPRADAVPGARSHGAEAAVLRGSRRTRRRRSHAPAMLIAFASELTALRQPVGSIVDRRLALGDYLRCGYVPAPCDDLQRRGEAAAGERG